MSEIVVKIYEVNGRLAYEKVSGPVPFFAGFANNIDDAKRRAEKYAKGLRCTWLMPNA